MLTKEQIEQRRDVIGASDIPKIMGLSKFGFMRDVYEEKIGNVPAYDAGFKARMGNAFEHTIMDFAVAEKLIPNVIKDCTVEFPNKPQRTIARIRANLDGVTALAIPVEIKMTGMESHWGSGGTDDVPVYVLAQVQCEMICCNITEALVVAFMSTSHGFDLRVYNCTINDQFLDAMFQRCDYLWKCIQNRTPPEGPMTQATAAVLVRAPNSETHLDFKLVANYLHAKEVEKAAKDGVDKLKGELFAALGDCEIGLAGELGSFHYKLVNRKAYSVEPSSYRKLRHLKAAVL